MKIPLTSETRLLDAATCAAQRITSYQLMERAARLAAEAIMRRWPDRRTRILVLAGAGNNGGDALVILRHLYEAGYPVLGMQYAPSGRLSPDCSNARAQLPPGVLFDVDLRVAMPELSAGDLIIDGLFGSGMSRPLQGGHAYLVHYVNESPARVVAIDLPSGLMGEGNDGHDLAAVVRADVTLTFTAPKLAFFLPDTAPTVGEWEVLDIGLDAAAVARSESPYHVITRADVSAMLHRRDRFSHKGTYGHALLVAGSRGMMGAALLAARACLRSGAGLLTVHVPACGYDIMQTGLPEAMCECDAAADHVSRVAAAGAYTALAVGPGLGRAAATAEALFGLLAETSKPMVLDADALNIIAAQPDGLARLTRQAILTPHPKEADRLLAAAVRAEILHDPALAALTTADRRLSPYARLQGIRTLATVLNVIIVLKGTYTAVCHPDGTTLLNVECGHAGMATGGSGDVLTGILLGLLAQHYPPCEAATIGVYLHALAADCALTAQSVESWLPSDLVDHIGEAYRRLHR